MRHTHRLIIAAALALSAAQAGAVLAPDHSTKNEGPAPACRPSVTVVAHDIDMSQVREVGTLDVRSLTTKLNRTGSYADAYRGHGLGATALKARVRSKVESDASGCDAITIEFSYADITVYIAANLYSNPCAVEHVRKHELEHIAIYRRYLETFAARAQADIDAMSPAFAGMKTADLEKAAAQLVFDKSGEVSVAHEDLDSPEEYAENGHACGGAIAMIARNAMRF